MKERIQHILLDKKLSASKFAEKLEVQPSGISHILSGRNKPGMDFIVKCLTVFPDINPEWFVLGTGPMYRSATDIGSVNRQGTSLLLDEASPTSAASATTIEHHYAEDDLPSPPSSLSEDYNKLSKIANQNGSIPENRNSNSTQKHICRVMVFYSDHTVESYDYSETV